MRLAIVLGLLALLVPFGPARAIDEDPCKDIEDTIPSLKACIEDLTKRIVELESEGDEAEAPEEEEKKKPEDDLADRVKKIEDAFASTLEVNDLKIKGALQVLDGEEVVFVVQPEDGGLRVEGKSSGGTGRFLLTATSDLTGLRAYSGDDKVAGLLTRQEDSSVFAGAGGVESNMVTGSDFNGWQLKSGDKEFANIGRPAGRAVAVRVMDDQGHAVVSAGSIQHSAVPDRSPSPRRARSVPRPSWRRRAAAPVRSTLRTARCLSRASTPPSATSPCSHRAVRWRPPCARASRPKAATSRPMDPVASRSSRRARSAAAGAMPASGASPSSSSPASASACRSGAAAEHDGT